VNLVRGQLWALPAIVLLSLLVAGFADARLPNSHRVAGTASAARLWAPRLLRRALADPNLPKPSRGSGEAQPTGAAAAGPARRVAGRLPLRRFLHQGGARASSVSIANASTVEDRTNGRVFGLDPVLGPYSCSGTSLNTPSGSIVLTAGHCVLENRHWGRDLIFIPAFDHGRRPFGTFSAEQVFTTPEWRRSENTDFDVAALLVKPNQYGTLASVVGSRGYETEGSRFAAFQIFGYPAGALGGEELRSCRTHGLGSDPLTSVLQGPPTVPSRCNMAAGSSGGAWIANRKYIDGITSYGYAHNYTHLYSPYFGAAIGDFLNQLP
jgi:V8-like Glu-specific endopeptidase